MTETWHQNRKHRNRAELVAAGRTLFLRRAFPGVTVKDVCELAGISRVTYYKHFDSIDELAFEVQMEALEHMENFVKKTAAETRWADGASLLRAMLEAWSLYAARSRDYMKFILLFDLHYDAYPPEKALRERYRTFILEKKERHFLNDALEAGIRDGSLRRDLDLRETGEFIFTAMMGLLQKLSLAYVTDDDAGHETSDDRHRSISRRLIDTILGSLRGEA
ncbi:TetR/AcrR family transcriptional regulator [Saccharibacillus alkalitolerans]|uniref:TetR/AcrR family transcriptional regulator n=1 Tax=Saccharibacillus alkalitolerans TaxID=2705290 RepID=A0ABX0F8L7_9BACL|nr:TetR/AcrR family transcriptional regulator [Saccharibacillus alkalitolerans]NGZ76354.1 TetR/AcrR family transcriptional regulator [Saccharibacillus alkalitolerans]